MNSKFHAVRRFTTSSNIRIAAAVVASMSSFVGYWISFERDLLCELAMGQGYEQILPFAQRMEDGAGTSINVGSLRKLIEIKAETGRAKDQLMIPLLLKLHERL